MGHVAQAVALPHEDLPRRHVVEDVAPVHDGEELAVQELAELGAVVHVVGGVAVPDGEVPRHGPADAPAGRAVVLLVRVRHGDARAVLLSAPEGPDDGGFHLEASHARGGAGLEGQAQNLRGRAAVGLAADGVAVGALHVEGPGVLDDVAVPADEPLAHVGSDGHEAPRHLAADAPVHGGGVEFAEGEVEEPVAPALAPARLVGGADDDVAAGYLRGPARLDDDSAHDLVPAQPAARVSLAAQVAHLLPLEAVGLGRVRVAEVAVHGAGAAVDVAEAPVPEPYLPARRGAEDGGPPLEGVHLGLHLHVAVGQAPAGDAVRGDVLPVEV